MAKINFFETRERKIRYYTIEFYHPAVGARRFVRNQFYDKEFTLESSAPHDAGEKVLFQAGEFSAEKPDISVDGEYSITVQLGRVGSDVKYDLKKIDEYNNKHANTEVTDFVYREFMEGETGPVSAIHLWVSNITIDGDTVAIKASDDNPNSINVSTKYNAQNFPGLRVLN